MNNQSIQHVVLGAGQLGLAIMDELIADGIPVKVVNRSGKVNEALPAGVTLDKADITDPDQVERVCAGADVVFFCTQPPYNKWPELFPPMAESVIEGVSRTDAKLVFGSNVYLYGHPHGQKIHEGMPAAAETRKGKARAKVAQLLMNAHRAGKVEVTIGRGSDFFGPRVRDSAVGELLFKAAIEGKTADMMGDLDQPHTYTYIRDFARSLITLSRHDEAYGRAWHVPNAPAGSTSDFIQLIEAEVGQPIKVRSAGRVILTIMGWFNPIVGEMAEMLYEFQQPFIIDDSRYRAQFGNGITPLPEAVKETVAWYKAQNENAYV